MKILCLALSLLAAASASAAPITWTTPTNETGNPSDIITSGTFFSAAYEGSSNLTVNGVTFSGFTSISNNLSSYGSSGIQLLNGTSPIGPVNVPPTWNSGYQSLVDEVSIGPSGAPTEIIINGLTSGTTYEVQILEGFWGENLTTAYSDGTHISTPLNVGVYSTGSQQILTLPQFVTGTFTASGSTQDIFVDGVFNANAGLFDAIQVRSAEGASVPEPTTIALLSAGLAGLLRRRRKTS
jgi:hypothetical protein